MMAEWLLHGSLCVFVIYSCFHKMLKHDGRVKNAKENNKGYIFVLCTFRRHHLTKSAYLEIK